MNVPEGQPRSPYSGKPIAGDLEPFDLFASDGEKVGTVVEVNDEFLVVQHGGFLGLGESHGKIPRSLVSTGDEDGWYLSVDQDRAKSTLENEGLYTPGDGEDYATPAGSMGEAAPRGDQTTQYGEETTQLGDRAPGAAGYPSSGTGGETMRTYEEDLRADTTTRQAGDVVARKEVVEETETIDVPVKREEVHVERRPATDTGMTGVDAGAPGETRFQEDEVHVPVMEEEVQVQKVARPKEEVTISKEQVEDTERVSGTVRKEHVEVDEETARR